MEEKNFVGAILELENKITKTVNLYSNDKVYNHLNEIRASNSKLLKDMENEYNTKYSRNQTNNISSSSNIIDKEEF